MSSLELEILRLIASGRHAAAGSVIMNSLHVAYSYQDIKAALTILTQGGWIRKTDLSAKIPACSFVIEPPGRLLLAEETEKSKRESAIRAEEEQKEQEAENKRIADTLAAEKKRAEERSDDRRFQKEITYRSTVLAAVINAILGAVIGNLDRIIPWILSLF